MEVADGQNSGNATILLAAIPPGLLRCRIFVLPHVYKAIWTTRIMFTQTVCIYGETAFRVNMEIKLLDKTWIYCQLSKFLAWNFCRVALTEMTNMQRAQSEKSWVAPQYVNNKHATKNAVLWRQEQLFSKAKSLDGVILPQLPICHRHAFLIRIGK